MAISAATCRASYTGNGATTAYSFSFKITDQTHVKVIKRLIASPYTETTLAIGTGSDDYAVTGVGDSAGGTVTLVTALPSTYTLQILLQRPVTQPTSIRNQGAYYPSVHEDALDHIIRVSMQQQDQLDRSIRQPESEAPLDMELPSASSRASKYMAFDSDGKPTATAGTTSSVVATAFWTSVLDDTTAAASIATYQGDLTEDTSPSVGDSVHPYKLSATAGRKVLLGAFVQGALESRGVYNLGLANATTTNANDSIKIQGAGATLSSTNPLYINLPTVSSPGRVTRFSATADVTVNLTGAHWALGTNGDFTDIILRVYAINDNGTLKWGVSNKGGLRSIVDTNSHTTATSVTTQVKMLVNSALTSGTWPCREVGWFLGDFDDTGGAAEDLWAVQTGAGEIMVGVPAPAYTDWESWSPTGGPTNTTLTGRRRRNGDCEEYNVKLAFTGVPGSNPAFSLPTGSVIDSSKRTTSSAASCGTWAAENNGVQNYAGVAYNSSLSAIAFLDSDGTGVVTATSPFSFDTGDWIDCVISLPILGRSGNQ